MTTKIDALATYLSCSADDITVNGHYYALGDKDYLVVTVQEADEAARESILDSLWAFRPSFLASHAVEGVDAEVFDIVQSAKFEDATPIFKRLIPDLDAFVADAIASDGRAHFLARYDGNEIELDGGFFAYRDN